MRKISLFVPIILSVGALIYGIVATIRMQDDVYWMPIGIVGLTFSILWATLFGPMVRNRRILRTGESGTARVLRMFETGVTVNDNPMVKLELEVTPPRGSTYVTMTKVVVSRLNPMMYGPGTVLPVKIDLKDQMLVVVDTNSTSNSSYGGRSGTASVNFAGTDARRNEAMTELLMASDKVRVEVLANGKDAEGTILSLWSLDINVNNMASGMEFLVEVEIPGKAPFKTEIKGVVDNNNLGKYQIGTRVKLKYDPADPVNRVTINGVV